MAHLKEVRAKLLPSLGQKWQKTDYFQEFYFTQSQSHKIGDNIASAFLVD